MANIQTMYRWEGEGVLKHKVPVEVDLDELDNRLYEQTIAVCERAIKKTIHDEATKLGYDNELSLCSYAAVENPYREEAENFIQWKASCWKALYDYSDSVKETPGSCLSAEEILKLIPQFQA